MTTAEKSQQTLNQYAAPAESVEAQFDRMLTQAARVTGEIRITQTGIEFGNFEGVQRYARLLVESGCVPPAKDETKQQQLARATISILLGRSVGLTPEQAVQSIYVVNGRPQLFGDAPLAIARQHPAWVEAGFREYWTVDGKTIKGSPSPEQFKSPTCTAVCETLRSGASEPYISTFSIADAKQAGLLGGRNQALYGAYPQRMLKARARGYCLRDNFGDALRGIGIRELAEPDDRQLVPVRAVVPDHVVDHVEPAVDPLQERLGLAEPAQTPEKPVAPATDPDLAARIERARGAAGISHAEFGQWSTANNLDAGRLTQEQGEKVLAMLDGLIESGGEESA